MKTVLATTLLFFLGATRAQAQKLERINPEGLSKSPGYTQVIKAGKLVFIAGQVGATADGKLAGPGMKEQYEQVLANLATALKSQGLDFSHVAMTTTFVTNIEEFRTPEVQALRPKHFGTNPPTSTLVQIVRLANPAYKVEVEAIAVLP
ncbi:MAG: RidA family protein [Terriglobia bacterium]